MPKQSNHSPVTLETTHFNANDCMKNNLLSHRRTPYHIHVLPHVESTLAGCNTQSALTVYTVFLCVFGYAVMVWLNRETLCLLAFFVCQSANLVQSIHQYLAVCGLTLLNTKGVTTP